MYRRTLAALGGLVVGLGATSASGASQEPREYRNCTALNQVYPHGVGKRGATDKTSGQRVTNFTRRGKVYRLNKSSDRDGDGIACEKS